MSSFHGYHMYDLYKTDLAHTFSGQDLICMICMICITQILRTRFPGGICATQLSLNGGSTAVDRLDRDLLRGTIVNRTYGTHKTYMFNHCF